MLSTPQTLQRKKSLPDVAGMPRMPDGGGMSREEVSALGSARREEVRRMHEETEKLRANPLLYLVSPQVKVRYWLLFRVVAFKDDFFIGLWSQNGEGKHE